METEKVFAPIITLAVSGGITMRTQQRIERLIAS